MLDWKELSERLQAAIRGEIDEDKLQSLRNELEVVNRIGRGEYKPDRERIEMEERSARAEREEMHRIKSPRLRPLHVGMMQDIPLTALHLHVGLSYDATLDQVRGELTKQREELSKLAKIKCTLPHNMIVQRLHG